MIKRHLAARQKAGGGGEAADHKFWPVESSSQASAARIPGSRRSKESSTHSSRRRRRRDIPPTSPGGRYAVFFKSGQRSGILPAFSSSIDCVVNVLSVRFLFLPGRPDKLFQRKKNIDIRERLSNLALLRFLPHSLSFAVKKFLTGWKIQGRA